MRPDDGGRKSGVRSVVLGLLTSVLCLLLAAAALRTAYAEAAYEEGLSLAEDPKAGPAADVPGRLDAYLEACRRDPGEARYALRAGQIRLTRAGRRSVADDMRGSPDNAELAAALGLLRTAAALRPLDCQVHAELARAAKVGGDSARASSEAAAAVRLGPRAPSVLAASAASATWAWRASGEVAGLRTALAAASNLTRMGETSAARALAAQFAAAAGALAGDLLQATSRDPELRGFAASLLRESRPELARMLERSRTPEPPR